MSLWLVGGGFVLLRQWRSLRLLEGLVRFAAVAPPNLSNRCAAIAGELGIRNGPTVVTASGAFSPFLWHPFVGEARVVIPGELFGQFSEEAIDAVLRHELIHLQRRDAWRRRIEVMVLKVERIFAFLNRKSKVVDRDRTRHNHAGLMRLSDLYEKEHVLCVEDFAS